MKKILCISLLVLLIFTSVCSVNAASVISDFEIREQKQAQLLYEFDKFYSREEKTALFINSFAGAYFDENDILHLNFTTKYKNEVLQSYEFQIPVIIEFVDYSIKELKEAQNELLKSVNEYSINRISINVVNNSLDTSTRAIIENLDEIIKNMIDITNVQVKYGIEDLNAMYTYSVTNGDYYTINGGTCTVGFAARNADGDSGFVTAGHCVAGTNSGVGEDIIIDGNTVGDIDSFIFEDYSTADAAFVDLRNDWWYVNRWIPSYNLVFNNAYDYYNTSTTYPVVGTVVAYYGDYNHDSIQYGEITDNSVIYNITTYEGGPDAIIMDMVETDIGAVGGDSGGPFIRTLYIGGGQYVKYVLGIMTGGNSTMSVYSKVGNILDELDLTTY